MKALQPHLFDCRTYTDTTRLALRELPGGEQPLERMEQIGAHALSNAELVELVIASRECMGREVLAQFETLPNLARASLDELTAIPGIGKGKAAALKAAIELGRRVTLKNVNGDKPKVRSPQDAANLVMDDMRLLDHEQLWVIILNSKNDVVAIDKVYKGSLNTTMVRTGELFIEALKRRAAAVIVVHNHPSGDPAPSPEDVKVTEGIVQAGSLLDVEVLDHVIVGDNRWISLKERGLGFRS